jgi:hypothetical protein
MGEVTDAMVESPALIRAQAIEEVIAWVKSEREHWTAMRAKHHSEPAAAIGYDYLLEGLRALSPLPPGSRVVVIPAEGTPEWEKMVERVWQAQVTAPKSRRIDGWRDTISAALRALTEGEKP